VLVVITIMVGHSRINWSPALQGPQLRRAQNLPSCSATGLEPRTQAPHNARCAQIALQSTPSGQAACSACT
jgi:hypothetical protein